jgi:hypothetical protein
MGLSATELQLEVGKPVKSKRTTRTGRRARSYTSKQDTPGLQFKQTMVGPSVNV